MNELFRSVRAARRSADAVARRPRGRARTVDIHMPNPSVRHGGKVLNHDLLELRYVRGAGRGWFALQDLLPGTELWKEKAFTVGRNRRDLVRRVDADLEKHAAFCRPAGEAAASSEGEGIVACNFFDNGKYTGAMLFEQTSMINHDCNPNASVHMLQSEFGACYARVTVARHVAAGEQLSITYSNANLFRPREWRPCNVWAFEAPCKRCAGVLPPEEQERWALLEAAAEAADAAKKLAPHQRNMDVALRALILQHSAVEVVSRYTNVSVPVEPA